MKIKRFNEQIDNDPYDEEIWDDFNKPSLNIHMNNYYLLGVGNLVNYMEETMEKLGRKNIWKKVSQKFTKKFLLNSFMRCMGRKEKNLLKNHGKYKKF